MVSLKRRLGIPDGVRLSYEIIGDIALLDYEGDVKKVAEALMEMHKNIKAVFLKRPVDGVFRVRKPVFVAGENRTITIHKESGCKFELDIAKVYFSPRLSYERERIAQLVERGERVMVLFAGVGPYPIVIAKNKNARVWGVELNPFAYYYFRRNIILNKLDDRVFALWGDAKRVSYTMPQYFDRVIMPLPMGSEAFIREGVYLLKRPGWLHTYLFVERDAIEHSVADVVRKAGGSRFNWRVVRPYSARVIQVAVDILIE